ncbi:hypothetical protein [Micromonospora chalcea]|uniref:hypothetical protein n=1 Tax=Micromonospora chalcea TaxID=1874 RepID=UPI0038018A9E
MPVRLVMDVLDAVEFDRRPVDEALNSVLAKQPLHEGLAAFIKHAARSYLSNCEAEPSMLPVARWWVVLSSPRFDGAVVTCSRLVQGW